uniref:Uncharacterized protein n=1 Tax=uncultured bacterium DX-8J-22 TaxID=1292055 RepID=M1KEV0_9BACT|nr:hypothetical protein [uncultured bacterium DX-8J-22]
MANHLEASGDIIQFFADLFPDRFKWTPTLRASASLGIVTYFYPGQMGGDRHAAGVPAYGTGGDRYGLRVGGCSLCTASGHGRTVFQNGFEEAFHRRDFGIQRFFPKTDLVGRELFRTASESPALQFGDGAFQAGDGFIAQGNGRLLLGDDPGAFRFLFLLLLQQAQHQIAQGVRAGGKQCV